VEERQVSIAELLRDQRASRAAQRDYLERAKDLRVEAAGHRAMGRIYLSRKCLQVALDLEHAAIAEITDPEWRPGQPTGEVDTRDSSAGSPRPMT
jgi:hypothetical protein